MNRYIHHIPGRLRVRLPALKANAAAGLDLERTLTQVGGVTAVDINPLTGSVLVHYDCSTETATRLIRTLKDHPFWEASETPSIESKIARKIALYVFETALERAAVAALAVLL